MKLNKYLFDIIGVKFNDKYNKLTVKEIIENKELYPHIYEMIAELVDNNESGKEIIKTESNYFDSDITYDSLPSSFILELYYGFLRAFAKSIIKNQFNIEYVRFGVNYLITSDIEFLFNQLGSYAGKCSITLNDNEKIISKEVYHPIYFGNDNYGHYSKHTEADTDFGYYDTYKNNVGKYILRLINTNDFILRFDLNDYPKEEIYPNIAGYRFDEYEIKIDDNIIKIWYTERGFDPYGSVRDFFKKSLKEKDLELDPIKRIFLLD